MKSAIVTGANGFIGKALCRRLLMSGVHTYAIVRDPKTMGEFSNNNNLMVVQGDITDPSSIRKHLKEGGYEVFYHLAWVGTSGKVLAEDSVQIRNIEYSCNMLRLAEELKCKKYIFAGTINELELLPLYKAEMFIPRAASIYGISKLTCDFMCKTLAANMNITYNTAIIGSCFGPGDMSWRIHNNFIKGMIEGVQPKLVSGEVWHDWVFIDDVAEMLLAVGDTSINLKNYYIGHRELRRLKDILCEVRDILCEGLELNFGEITDNFKIDYSLVDLNAVYEDTGYECKTDFSLAILKTAKWVRERMIKNI